MNIISGKYKGRSLRSPDSARPTLARVKTSLFSMLNEYINEDCMCLDLFAGSGALGFEVLSRGAKFTYFIDSDKNAVRVIESNLRGVDKSLYAIYQADAVLALRNLSKQNKSFDIIFIDPPYASKLGAVCIDIILRLDLLNDDGVIVFETDDATRLQKIPSGCIIAKEKDYGTAKIIFLKRIKNWIYTNY